MDNLEMLNEFFSNCHEPKTPKIRSRLISLLYQFQQIIWIQRNEQGTVELAYLKKELAQIIQNEYSIKLSSFERKLKEDLGLKVVQTTHGRRNIKLFHTPAKYGSNDPHSMNNMETSFVQSNEMIQIKTSPRSPSEIMQIKTSPRSPEVIPCSPPNKYDLHNLLNPMSMNNMNNNNAPRMDFQPKPLIQMQIPNSSFSSNFTFQNNSWNLPPIQKSEPTTFLGFNHQSSLHPFSNNNSNSFNNSNNNNNNNNNRNFSYNEYEAAVCLTHMKTNF